MKKPKNKKSKKKVILISILIIIFIFIVFIKPLFSIKETETALETETIARKSIAQSISSTGTVKTNTTQNIISTLSGYKISSINVKEGDYVNEGDVICEFDMSSVEDNLSTAKSTASIANEQANIGVESAQRSLSDAYSNRDTQIIELQKSVASAQQAYDNAVNQSNTIESTIESKKTEIATLSKSEGNENQINQLNDEISELQSALSELQASIPQLKLAYETAISTLNSTSDSLDSSLASLQDNLKNAELSSKSAKISGNSQIQGYKDQIEDGTVKSTVSGTVTSINVKEGDIYTGSVIAVVSGIDEMIIESEIDEYDIPDVKVGMRCLIKTDATRDEELEGEITYVALSATTNATSSLASTSSSGATYTVKIALKNNNDRLRIGMNAKISIIVDSRENVLAVPYNALYERDDGTYYIEVTNDSENKYEVNVEKGLEGSYYVEVISDELKEGMLVVLPETEANNSLESLIEVMGADAGV